MVQEAYCECNVYLCTICGHVDGVYHGSNMCMGKEYYTRGCKRCHLLYDEDCLKEEDE